MLMIRNLVFIGIAWLLAACNMQGGKFEGTVRVVETEPTPTPTPTTGLLGPQHLHYQGAFRLPQSQGESQLCYSSLPMAYRENGNNGNGSLFVVARDNKVFEIDIPNPVKSKNIPSLNSAQPVSIAFDPTLGLRNQYADMLEQNEGHLGININGLYWDEERRHLLWTLMKWYNVSGHNHLTHGLTDFSQAPMRASGLWRLADYHSQKTGEFISLIPENYRSQFQNRRYGGGAMIGQGRAATSLGPSFYSFNTPNLNNPHDEFIGDVHQHMVIPYQGRDGFNPYNWEGSSLLDDMEFIQMRAISSNGGTIDSVVYLVRRPIGQSWYGKNGDNGLIDACGGQKGYHSEGKDAELWFYNPQQIANAQDPTSIRPYAQFTLGQGSEYMVSPNENCAKHAYMTYASDRQQLFIVESGVDYNQRAYCPTSIIHVFNLSAN